MPRGRLVAPEPPSELGRHDGLAFARYDVEQPRTRGGVLVLHGADSRKENHYDFCRELRGHGISSLVFDMRGHGESGGELDGRALQDVVAMAGLLPPGPRALRGTSMGGYFSLIAAERIGARAVVAICPAGADLMRRGLRAGRFQFSADLPALDALLAEHDELDAVRRLQAALMLMHAEGDESVPVEHSRLLLGEAGSERKRLIAAPGGDHRSIQHDAEMQAVSAMFLARELATASGRAD
ncbi:MAG TPA: alpha/beta fold hydrolase [Solirubrobacteraceae bacterium]|jgi:alpha-beta hydrolase superfamily lysophospholipase|nr:alpha/beta fold hydrolase [Solirubrobacteraceae bacterium]